MLSLNFSGRAYLDNDEYNGPSNSYGTDYFQWIQGSGRPSEGKPTLDYEESGHLCPVHADFHKLQFWVRQSSTTSSLNWGVELWVQRKYDNSRKFENFFVAKTDVFNFRDTDNHFVSLDLQNVDFDLRPGDVIIPLFARHDDSGSSRRFAYVSSGSLTLRDI